MSFPAYEECKDSGVEWLGDIPSHWVVAPFNRVIERNDGGVWGQDPTGEGDTIVLRSTEQTAGGQWKIEDPAWRHLSTDEESSAQLETGDLLLTKSSGSSLHIGKTTLVSSEVAALKCCYSNFMQRIRTSHLLLPELAWYILNNDLARLQFDLLSNSTTGLANLNGTVIGQIVVPVPPLPEQTAIASFLDTETSKIDSLVDQQRRLIELLKEKRQAVISRAVTKGLDPSVPMKDSGIEWLGEVPKHWEVVAIKHIVSTPVTDGPHETPEFIDEGIPFVSAEAVSSGKINFAKIRGFISQADHDSYCQKYKPERGDVYMVKSGASTGTTAIVEDDREFSIWSPLAAIRCDDESHPNFILNFLRSQNFQEGVTLNWSFGTQQNIGMKVIENLQITRPPLPEQRTIASFLKSETSKFDTLVAKAESAIELLQERRTALISAAVTGKIDVREFATEAVA